MTTAALNRLAPSKLWYFVGATRMNVCNPLVTNPHPALLGDTTNITGSASGIFGGLATGLSGDVGGLTGRISNVVGDATGIHGDATLASGDFNACGLTAQDRVDGVDITTLIQP